MTRVVRDGQTGPGRCRDCGGRIVWAISDVGKRVRVDAQQTIDPRFGYLILFHDQDQTEQRVTHVATWELEHRRPYQGPRWTLHTATCPDRKGAGEPAPAPSRQLRLTLLEGGKRGGR